MANRIKLQLSANEQKQSHMLWQILSVAYSLSHVCIGCLKWGGILFLLLLLLVWCYHYVVAAAVVAVVFLHAATAVLLLSLLLLLLLVVVVVLLLLLLLFVNNKYFVHITIAYVKWDWQYLYLKTNTWLNILL